MTIDEKLDRILELLEQLVRQTAPKPRAQKAELPTPLQSASIGEWLDWRDAKRKRNQRVTLEEIAVQSKWSLSTLKKASMQRRKPKA